MKLFLYTDNLIKGNMKQTYFKYVEEEGFAGLVILVFTEKIFTENERKNFVYFCILIFYLFCF